MTGMDELAEWCQRTRPDDVEEWRRLAEARLAGSLKGHGLSSRRFRPDKRRCICGFEADSLAGLDEHVLAAGVD